MRQRPSLFGPLSIPFYSSPVPSVPSGEEDHPRNSSEEFFIYDSSPELKQINSLQSDGLFYL